MMQMSDAAIAIDGTLAGGNKPFSGVSIDSRTLMAGNLFIAIRGRRFDGHEFIERAAEMGAAGAIVDGSFNATTNMPLIRVEDTLEALWALASSWRKSLPTTVIAVAGANGKTTTKEMIARILREHAGDSAVVATPGNHNNQIGVPLTLLNLRAEHRYAVVEIGMNHFGEISRLVNIVRPNIGLVTNAQREHLEFIGSSADSASENACLYEGMSGDATAIVNFDDSHKDVFMRAVGRRKCITFGFSDGASVKAVSEAKEYGSLVKVTLPGSQFDVQLHIQGLHNVRNAMGAAGASHAAGISAQSIQRGLEAFRPYKGRMNQRLTAGGVRLIDDTYNANPDSVLAAIDVLASASAATILILGDMGEVGEHREAVHREVGVYAREQGVDMLFALGEATMYTVTSFGPGATHFESAESLLAVLIPNLCYGTTVLVKGSRFMGMERIVEGILRTTSDHGGTHAA